MTGRFCVLFVSVTLVVAGIMPVTVMAAANDNPLVTKVMLNEFEYRAVADDIDSFSLDGDVWGGYDLNKLWLTVAGDVTDGHVAEAELQALYSRAIAAFWDVQVGVRADFRPEPDRQWLTAGLRGIAPYFFDIDAAVFLSDGGHTALRVDADYMWLITQKLILQPNAELDAYGKDDAERGIGSGLSSFEFGLRMRYEIRREFAPYVGVRWEGKFGNTAKFAERAGESKRELQFLLGLRAWF